MRFFILLGLFLIPFLIVAQSSICPFTIGPDVLVCTGASFRLNPNGPTNGQYKWSGSPSLSCNDCPHPVLTLNTPGIFQYVLSYTAAQCTFNDTLNVTVFNGQQPKYNIVQDQNICLGQSVNLGGPTISGTSYFWFSLPPDVNRSGANPIITPTETITWYLSASNTTCAITALDSVRIRVGSLPDISIAPSDTTICPGQPVQLTSPPFPAGSFPDITFRWMPVAGINGAVNTANVVVAPLQTTVYQRISENTGCRDTSSARITVRSNGAKIVPSDTTICLGQSVQLSFEANVNIPNITWSPATGLSCANCAQPMAMPVGTTTYIVSGTDPQTNCPFSASATIRVNTDKTVQFPTDTKLCIGEKIKLNTIQDPFTAYIWTSSDLSFGTVRLPQPESMPTKTATYFVKTTNTCGVRQDQVRIEVFDGALQTSNDTTVCRNFPALLIASGAFPGTYTWDDGQMGQAINVMTDRTRTYKVRYTYGDGCELTDSVVVFIANASADVVFPKDTRICAGESIKLNTQATTGASYEWTSSPPGFTSSAPLPEEKPNENTIYLVTTKLGNCIQTQTLSVEVAKASLQITKDTVICKGEVLTLRAVGSAIGEVAYRWILKGDTVSKNDTWSLVANVTNTYNLLYTFGDGCKIERRVNVTLRQGLDSVSIVAEPDTNKIFSGESITLRAVISPTQSLAGFQLTWLENETTAVGSGETITISRTTGEDATKYQYSLTAKASNGCKKINIFNLTVCPDLIVFPNVFTPDGDQVNDTFGMYVIGGNVKSESFEVYNRWGKRIFQSNEPAARWDGNVDGNQAPTDIYVYILQYRLGDGKLLVQQGEVTLLR